MREKKRRILAWILVPVLAAGVMFAVEGICSLPLNALPQEQKGVLTLPVSDFVLKGAPVGETDADGAEEDYDEDEPPEDEIPEDGTQEVESIAEEAGETGSAKELYFSDTALSASIVWTGYVHRLEMQGGVFSDTDYTLTCMLKDGGQSTYSGVFSASLPSSSVLIDREITGFTLTFAQGEVSLTGVIADNTFRLNATRMLFSFLAAAAVCLLLLMRKTIARRPEYGFLIVALASGIFLCVGMPAVTALSYDDQIHFENVWKMSWGKTAYTTDASESLSTLTFAVQREEDFAYELNNAADYAQLIARLDTLEANAVLEDGEGETNQWKLYYTGYLPHALGMAVSRALGCPLHVQIIVARLMGMLGYVALCFAAIRVLKRFKLTLAAIALMPTPMYLACNFSYDPICNGLCFLGIALTVDAMTDHSVRLSWRRLAGILLSFVLASTVKAVYVPLLLLVLLLPREKFASKAQGRYVKLAAVFVMLLAVGAILLDISGDVSTIEDVRGDAADASGQIAFILAHPLTYLSYFFNAIWTYFYHYFLDGTRTTWAYLGTMSGTLDTLSLLLLLFTWFTDNDGTLDCRVTWQQRLGLLLIGGVTVGLTFTAMYVGYSAVGSSSFGGVQSRYLLPALPLMGMLFSQEGVQNTMRKNIWYTVFCLLNLLVLMTLACQLVLINLKL